jgi:hypothetical protein
VRAARVRLRGRQPFGKADEHQLDAAGSEHTDVARMNIGQPERWQSALDRADDFDPVPFEVEQLDRRDAQQHRHEIPRNIRRDQP